MKHISWHIYMCMYFAPFHLSATACRTPRVEAFRAELFHEVIKVYFGM